MVDWLAGKRIKGTSSERTTGTWTGLPSGSVGGWVELGRGNGTANGTTINVSSLTDKRYYMFLYRDDTNGQNAQIRFGSSNSIDSSGTNNVDGNYARRQSRNATESTKIYQAEGIRILDNNTSTPTFAVGYVSNKSNKEKYVISHGIQRGTSGAGYYPSHRIDAVGKWANSSNAIDIMQINSSSLTTNCEFVVLGYDPSDTHTTNFWQEIGSATGNNVTDVTASSKKKYNWVQGHVRLSSGSGSPFGLRVGDGSIDGNSNRYAVLWNNNFAGSDSTAYVNYSSMLVGSGFDSNYPVFFNTFFINESGDEKLFITHINYHDNSQPTSNPASIEIYGKYNDSSSNSQVDHFGFYSSSGTFTSDSVIKWWGSD